MAIHIVRFPRHYGSSQGPRQDVASSPPLAANRTGEVKTKESIFFKRRTLMLFFFFFLSSYIACDLYRSWRLNLHAHILSTVRERLVVDPPCPPPVKDADAEQIHTTAPLRSTSNSMHPAEMSVRCCYYWGEFS